MIVIQEKHVDSQSLLSCAFKSFYRSCCYAINFFAASHVKSYAQDLQPRNLALLFLENRCISFCTREFGLNWFVDLFYFFFKLFGFNMTHSSFMSLSLVRFGNQQLWKCNIIFSEILLIVLLIWTSIGWWHPIIFIGTVLEVFVLDTRLFHDNRWGGNSSIRRTFC